MRLGLLSTARINDAILAAAAESDRVDVVAVASRDGERARLYADEHGIARAHGSYEALLGDSEVDAIYVSLPNALHHEWTMSALRAGKHVLCEKPYSRDPADVEQAFATARLCWARPHGGVHVSPPPPDACHRRARAGRSARQAALGTFDVHVSAREPHGRESAAGARWRRVDGCRVLLRQRHATDRRRARIGLRYRNEEAEQVSTWPSTGRCNSPTTW